MSNIDKRALRKAAMHAKTEDDWGYDADNFHDKPTPDAVLALLDELEAAENRIAELEEKQRLIDICQGQGLEHRIAAEKRAEAAEQRVAELVANKGKPVMFIDGDISASDAEKLAAVIREWEDVPAPVVPDEMETRELAAEVELPDVEKWRSVDAVRAQNAYKVLVSKVLAAAGIGVKG